MISLNVTNLICLSYSLNNLTIIDSLKAKVEPTNLGFLKGITNYCSNAENMNTIIVFFCIIISFVILFLLLDIYVIFSESNSESANNTNESNIMEWIFMLAPLAIIYLLIIASLGSIYVLDEVHDAEVYINITASQWKWTYTVENLPAPKILAATIAPGSVDPRIVMDFFEYYTLQNWDLLVPTTVATVNNPFIWSTLLKQAAAKQMYLLRPITLNMQDLVTVVEFSKYVTLQNFEFLKSTMYIKFITEFPPVEEVKNFIYLIPITWTTIEINNNNNNTNNKLKNNSIVFFFWDVFGEGLFDFFDFFFKAITVPSLVNLFNNAIFFCWESFLGALFEAFNLFFKVINFPTYLNSAIISFISFLDEDFFDMYKFFNLH